MAGIYVHIPYCRQACSYCDFHFSTLLKNKSDLLRTIAAEIEMRRNYLKGERVDSIYFGGGTPSVMTSSEARMLLGSINRQFEVSSDAEVTLEANPDDLDLEKLNELRRLGFNRLSIGIQSFDEEVLQWMNRSHNATQALDAVAKAREAGFENLTVDMIYGIPGRDNQYWQSQMEQLLRLSVPHISAYALTVEKETMLDNWIRKGKTTAPDEDQAHEQFISLSESLTAAGYEHYELSNFARPGFRAVHNSAYWKSRPYLGVGPSAHSYDGNSRQWNVSNNRLYHLAIESGELNSERETLSMADHLNEKVMTALRTSDGLNLNEVDQQFGAEFRQHIMKEANMMLEEGRLELRGDQLHIPLKQRFYSDGIASALFYI